MSGATDPGGKRAGATGRASDMGDMPRSGISHSPSQSGGRSDDHQRSAVEIEREVEATRARLSSAVEEVRERVSPGQLGEEALDYFRASGGRELLENLGQQIRDNPVPTILIGAGLTWMLLSSGRKTPSSPLPASRRGRAASSGETTHGSQEQFHEARYLAIQEPYLGPGKPRMMGVLGHGTELEPEPTGELSELVARFDAAAAGAIRTATRALKAARSGNRRLAETADELDAMLERLNAGRRAA